MLPIRDTIRSHSFPIANWLLIIANSLIFLLEINLSTSAGENLILAFGLVPARLSITQPDTWYPVFTSMFLHSGWFHFLSNMWVLGIFGDNVEDRLGSRRYLLFYLISGFAAAIVEIIISPESQVPVIGASGAIAGILGAYLILFPTARILSIIPIIVLPWLVEIPAVLYLGFWFISQLFSGLLSITSVNAAQGGGVAWWAHIGGFLFGLLFGPILAHRKQPDQWYPDQYYPW